MGSLFSISVTVLFKPTQRARIMFGSFPLKTTIATAIAVGALGILPSVSSAGELKVHFRNGTTITGDVKEQSVAWTTVAATGMVSQFVYTADQIKSLSLSTSKSSAELIKIRKLFNQLSDHDYHRRQSAEQQLQTIGGPYRGILQTYADHPSLDVRYRLQRLLDGFGTTQPLPRELDRITLVDGSSWEGEATDFRLTVQAYGKTFRVDRQNAEQLVSAPTEPEQQDRRSAVGDAVDVQLFHQFDGFVDPSQKEFRFDLQSDGSPMPFKTNLNRAYIADGLLLRSEGLGFVGASPFSFRYENLPVGGRSAGLLGQPRGRDFKGVMVIEFCQPNNENVPAGVYEIGTFIAKVNFKRDIILEAYGAHGQLLATVESTDQKCVFAGVKSNQLITKVRILSNPYLQKVERVIDDDFAIDSLRISAPIPVQVDTAINVQQAVLKNGDVLKWSDLNVTQDSSLRLMVNEISDSAVELVFPLEVIGSVTFGRLGKTTNAWQALLSDGSRVNVLPGKSMKSTQFKFEVAPGDVVGCWPAVSSPRIPVSGDFETGDDRPLIVFPTCRLRTGGVNFLADRITWKVDQKLEQPLQLGDRDDDQDPTPQQTSFKYADTLANQLPTVWNRPPRVLDSGQGFIFLTDGQRLAIGDQSRFRLKGIGTRTITVSSRGSTPVDIPLSEVQSIGFPVK